jgi:hypothetical protein
MHDADDDLSRYRYHTGATLRRLAADEPCPRLYRDLGPAAMACFLRGRLDRLAGPRAPILYTRAAGYGEPYRDYEPVGRLVFLRPRQLRPWLSGVEHVYVAPVRHRAGDVTVGFLPADVEPTDAEGLLAGVTDVSELREALGGRLYDESTAETLAGLDRLNRELAATEVLAEPIRRQLQSPDCAAAEAVRGWMARHRLTEADLCTAWHHLPRQRRALLRDALAGPAPAA